MCSCQLNLVCLSILLATGSCAFSAQQHSRAARLRQLSGAAPHDLHSAKRLHSTLLGKARAIERVYGHVTRPPVHRAMPQPAVYREPIIKPAAMGADPSGKRDSTEAFEAAVKAVLASATRRHSGTMASGIVDLGGATIDLLGGTYNISRPLVFPELVGNFQIVRGMIRASPSFPPDRFLIEIGNTNCFIPGDGQDVCNEYVNVNELMLDASHIAAGGITVGNTMGLTIGPSIFITGFNEAGIRVQGGHEIMVTEAWLAEYYWNEDAPWQQSKSIGIELSAPDNIVSNVIVFDFAHVGVLVGDGTLRDGCNVLESVHTWNGGGVGIQVATTNVRIIGSYLDWNYLDVINPNTLIVESTLFLNTHTVWHHNSPGTGPISDVVRYNRSANLWSIQSVRFRDNMYVFFSGDQGYNKVSIELMGEPWNKNDVSDVIVADTSTQDDDAGEGAGIKTTTARKTLMLSNATIWEFDFADVLLLPWIDEVMYSFTSAGTIVGHVARPAVGTKVSIVAAQATTATVTVEVSQGVSRSRLCKDGSDSAAVFTI